MQDEGREAQGYIIEKKEEGVVLLIGKLTLLTEEGGVINWIRSLSCVILMETRRGSRTILRSNGEMTGMISHMSIMRESCMNIGVS